MNTTTSVRPSAPTPAPLPQTIAHAAPEAVSAAPGLPEVEAQKDLAKVTGAPTIPPGDVTRKPIRGSYIVSIRSDEPIQSLTGLPQLAGAQAETFLGTMQGPDGFTTMVEVKSPHSLASLKQQLAEDPRVQWVEQNYEYSGNIMEAMPAHALRARTNDPQLGDQHHLNVMQAIEAWDVQKGSPEIIVAVTDNGTDPDHEDLTDAIWRNPGEIPGNGIDDDGNGFVDDDRGWNFSGRNNRTKGGTHGSHTVGIVGATQDNGKGVSGTAAGVSMMPIKWDGESSWTSAVIAASYTYAANNGAKIVSTSYNIDRWPGDRVVERALDYMESKGMLHFNSAGNGRAKDPNRSQLEQVILVASTEANGKHDDQKSSFSNYGSGIDLAAPGGGRLGILSTTNDHRYGRMSGTSMAAPNAAAVAALVWSQNPEWNREQVYAKVVATADNIDAVNSSYIDQLGAGRVNALRAVTEEVPPPRITADTTRSELVVRLRNVLDTESANLPESFRIERVGDGTIVSQGASKQVRIATNELKFSLSDLPRGTYRFVASADHLKDPFGQALDGNGDGEAGGDFVFEFTV